MGAGGDRPSPRSSLRSPSSTSSASMVGGERQNWNEEYCDSAGSSPSDLGACTPPGDAGMSIGGEWLRGLPGPESPALTGAVDGCINLAAASEPSCCVAGSAAPENAGRSSKSAQPGSANSHKSAVGHACRTTPSCSA